MLDQTYGRNAVAYRDSVPKHCKLLLGSKYALLRPEFSALRKQALQRRSRFESVENILVAMGGADPENVTRKAIEGLERVQWEPRPRIRVVLGAQAPHWKLVKKQALESHLDISVHRAVKNMADLMLEADIAVGASGTSTWERCCLVLPSFVAITADNQVEISSQLDKLGAIRGLGRHTDLSDRRIEEAINELRNTPQVYRQMVDAMKTLCDGTGTELLSRRLR